VFSLSSFGEACSPRRRPRQSLKLDVHIFVPPAGPNCFLNGPIVNGKAKKWSGGRFGNLSAASPLVFPTLPDPKMSIGNSAHQFINSVTNL
jgi:hypothetical protein